jgi:hypothetical protein
LEILTHGEVGEGRQEEHDPMEQEPASPTESAGMGKPSRENQDAERTPIRAVLQPAD